MSSRRQNRAALVSHNFVKNNYRRKLRHCKRKLDPDSAHRLGARYRNGQLKVTRFRTKVEWNRAKQQAYNENLYHEMLSPNEIRAELLAKARASAITDEASLGLSGLDSTAQHPFKLEDLEQKRGCPWLPQDRELLQAATEPLAIFSEDELKIRAELDALDAQIAVLEQENRAWLDAALNDESTGEIKTQAPQTSAPTLHTDSPSATDEHHQRQSDDLMMLKLSQTSRGRLQILKSAFGFESFQPGQEVAIKHVLRGESTLLLLPTGSGKSLCYQLPAFVFPGVTLVVTPLISLMEDQLAHLPRSLPGAIWSSTTSPTECEVIMRKLQKGELKVLYVSPEKVLTPGFQRFMTLSVPAEHRCVFACIDEAHCVSEWSHCFRPSYLRLARILHEVLQVRVILALTATATLATQATLCRALHINPKSVLRAPILRSNLILTASMDKDRHRALCTLLSYIGKGSAIVYATTQRETEALASFLVSKKFSAECYHAGLSPQVRAATQLKFMTNRVRVVVATIAFGMGLDKRDVRAVVHFNAPRTLEHYVQEIGRAGRDGEPAYCHCFFNENDEFKLKSLVYSDGVERPTIRNIINKLFIASNGPFSGEVHPAGTFVALNLNELLKSEGADEQLVGTLLTSLELISAPVLCSHLTRSFLEPGGMDRFVKTVSEDPKLFSGVDPCIRFVGTIHATVRVGFVGSPAKEVARHSLIVDAILQLNGVDTSNLDGDDEDDDSSGLKSAAIDEEVLIGRKRIRSYLAAKGGSKHKSSKRVGSRGRYPVDLCELANVLQVHIADVQRELLALKAQQQVVLEWEDSSFCVQILREPSVSSPVGVDDDAKPAWDWIGLDVLVDIVLKRMNLQESCAVRKVAILSDCMRLGAYPTFEEAYAQWPRLTRTLQMHRACVAAGLEVGAATRDEDVFCYNDEGEMQDEDDFEGKEDDEDEEDEEDEVVLELLDDDGEDTRGTHRINASKSLDAPPERSTPSELSQSTSPVVTSEGSFNPSDFLVTALSPLQALIHAYFYTKDEDRFCRQLASFVQEWGRKSDSAKTNMVRAVIEKFGDGYEALLRKKSPLDLIRSLFAPIPGVDFSVLSRQCGEENDEDVSESDDSDDIHLEDVVEPSDGLAAETEECITWSGFATQNVELARTCELSLRAFVRSYAMPRYFALLDSKTRPRPNDPAAPGRLMMSGRDVAKIFHGIGSNQFPASQWQSNPYWGEFFRVPFTLLMNRATEILREATTNSQPPIRQLQASMEADEEASDVSQGQSKRVKMSDSCPTSSRPKPGAQCQHSDFSPGFTCEDSLTLDDDEIEALLEGEEMTLSAYTKFKDVPTAPQVFAIDSEDEV